jgi:hypothetical protein
MLRGDGPAQKDPVEEDVGANEAELSFREDCDSVDRDATWWGPGVFLGTTNDYDHAGCRHAFVLDFVNADPNFPNNYVTRPWFRWVTPPTNPVDCERASILVYSWDSDLNGNPLTANSSPGFWNTFNNFCSLQVEMPVPRENEVTRYAISARQGLANGTDSKRKVRVDFDEF